MTNIGLFLLLLGLGYGFGRMAEHRHFKSIRHREQQMIDLPVVASRYPPKDQAYGQQLVSGSVVISSDYFKAFVSGLITLFGGRLKPFESLIERARREALLRMKGEAARRGAKYVFNIKFETSRIQTGRVGAVEVLAYGTAMIPSAVPTPIA